MRAHIGECHGGVAGTSIAAVIACSEGDAEGSDSAGDFDGVVHPESRFDKRDDGRSGGQFGGGAVDIGRVLCGGEHNAAQTFGVFEGFNVFPPVLGGDSVDAHPCDHAGVEHFDDSTAGFVFFVFGAPVFEV